MQLHDVEVFCHRDQRGAVVNQSVRSPSYEQYTGSSARRSLAHPHVSQQDRCIVVEAISPWRGGEIDQTNPLRPLFARGTATASLLCQHGKISGEYYQGMWHAHLCDVRFTRQQANATAAELLLGPWSHFILVGPRVRDAFWNAAALPRVKLLEDGSRFVQAWSAGRTTILTMPDSTERKWKLPDLGDELYRALWMYVLGDSP